MMRNFIYALMAVVMTIFTSCSSNDDVTRNYVLTVNALLPEGTVISEISKATVTVTNTSTGRSFQKDNVAASYEFVVPAGVYDIQVALGSNNGTETYALNGAKLGENVFADSAVDVALVKGTVSGLVFKEVYYNMVKPNGKMPYMADQFMEIYNNSDEVLYLDNCIIGILEGTQGTQPSVWVGSDGQLMDKYPLAYYTIAFVGDGTKYPVQPGKSVVIASQAQDHTQITTEMYDPENPDAKISPVNLTNANYEVCLTDYKPDKAIDNQSVPNMDIIFNSGTQNYFMVPYTGNAVILAKLPVDPYAFATDKSNLMAKPESIATTEYLMIPQEYVLDGINIVNNADKLNQQVIRLRPEVDGGKVFNNAAYCGLSIRRKVESINANGRAVLKDTNNSSEDFLTNQVPTPGVIPTTVD